MEKLIKELMYSNPTPEELAALPLAQCGVPIYLVPRELSLKEATAALLKEPILGFDTETKPAFRPGQKYPPALLQLATGSAIYLIQFSRIRDISLIKKILLAPNMKVGVGVPEDLRRLQYYFNIPFGKQFCDLTALAKKKDVPVGSLRGLCGALLKTRLSKAVQLTNWARTELSPAQIHYAALDAWISREIYLALKKL